MDRRRFVAVTAGGMVCTPLAAPAQPAKAIPKVGVLVPSPKSGKLPVEAVPLGLRDLGYVEGRNITLEWRYADGRPERLKALAQELVGLGVDVIHAAGPEAVNAAKDVTSTIPVVGVGGRDPVASGWAASLARPGGNVTGLTVILPGLVSKNLALLKEAAPRITRVASFWDASLAGSPGTVAYHKEVEDAARQLGLQIQLFGLKSSYDFEPSFEAARRWRAKAVHLSETARLLSHRHQLAALATKYGMPGVALTKATAEAGILLAYGPDVSDLHRRAAAYVDKILKGEKAGNLPFEQPTKFELVVNLKTAKALGLTILPSLLLRADEVLQ